jgi:hypothetical protein
MRTSFVRYVSPTPRHTSFRKERAIVGAARGRSASAIPDLELIHPGVSDLNRETPFGNSTRILSVVVAHLHCAELGSAAARCFYADRSARPTRAPARDRSSHYQRGLAAALDDVQQSRRPALDSSWWGDS